MSDSEDENFCFYGKALEPYDEDAVPKKKPISIEDQIATDAQGRRRFHGAFTGGFSAGFYNTVGSLEGWKPADFKSSRSEKAQSKQSRPEDFMDDEDIGEHGIAPQTVKATNDYASNRKRKKQMFSDGPIPGEPVLHTLITSGNETIGYLLMKNMDLKQKSKESMEADLDGPKVYGCVMPKTYEIRRNINYEDAIPEIYANQIKNPKSNSFGLGYEGLDKSHLNLFKSTQFIVKDKDNKKLSISGQAFGVGAFEHEDDDIYAKDDMSQYDFELTGEKKAASSAKRNDMIFERFVLSKVPLLSPQKFPPPVIPHSFSGKHKVKKSRFEPVPEEKVERRDMTAQIRAKYIGEDETQPKPGCSSEVVNVTPTLNETSSSITKNETQRENSEGNHAMDLFLDKFVSASQPENPHNILEEVTKSESEHGTKEMRDAAKLKMYGPLTRIISDWQPCSLLCKRFNVREPLLDDRLKKADRKKNHIIFEYQKGVEENIPLQPGLKVVKEESPPPCSDLVIEKESVSNEIEVQQSDSNQNKFGNVETKDAKLDTNTEASMHPQTSTEDTNTVVPDITDKIDVSKNIDLFKAVFLSSSESESENEENKQEEEKNREDMMKENVLNDYLIPKIKSTKEGILSHIKFNPLFKNKICESPSQDTIITKQISEEIVNHATSNEAEEMKSVKDPNVYGPVLPDKVPTFINTYVPNTISDDEWVEKDDADKKKSHKHKKKHKKEKHHKKERKSKYKY